MPVEADPGGPKPRLLVVGGSVFQRDLLIEAKGIAHTIVVDGSPVAPGLALGDEARVVDIRDVPAVVRLAQGLDIDGVVTGASDVAVPAVSAVAEALGLPGLLPQVTERCRDKLLCFESLRAASLPAPHTRAISTQAEADAAVAALGGFPVVVKPRSGGGGRGVSVVRQPSELGPALERARVSSLADTERSVLVQAFVSGLSLGVEAFFIDSVLRQAFILDDQFESDFVSPAGHSLPPDVDRPKTESIWSAIAQFGRALGITTGGVNFDLRQTATQTIPIEVNPRLGGNSITSLLRHGYGVNVARAAVFSALGREPTDALTPNIQQPVASRLILREGRGIARCKGALDAFEQHPDVINLELTVRDGQPTSIHVDAFTLLGVCLVQGQSAAEAVELAAHIAHGVANAIRLDGAA